MGTGGNSTEIGKRNMPDFRELAQKYIDNGFWVIPVNSTKQPALANWSHLQTRAMDKKEVERYFKDCFGIGLLCGGAPRVVAFDFDLKYDLSGDLFERFKKKVPTELLKKMYVQTTKNGGYHFAFKAPETRLYGNQKLANRYTTAYERHQTYMDMFQNPKTMDMATKVANNDRSRVLIETRSGSMDRAGGYILISPTEGYITIYGKITEITEEEYDCLEAAAMEFNEVSELDRHATKKYDNVDWKVSPFDDYTERGDALMVLYENGWQKIDERNGSVRLKRPGQTFSNSSASYSIDKDTLYVFSTSTVFEPNKGYGPTGIFNVLECDGDWSLCYKKLVELGYGEK